MTIEIHINGKPARIWQVDYKFGPFPMDDEMIEEKERDMKIRVLECKIDAAPMIYENPYKMFAVVKSRLSCKDIDPNDFANFLMLVDYNKKKRLRKAAIDIYFEENKIKVR